MVDDLGINEDLNVLITGMAERYGRLPTEDEVMDFITGTPEERDALWNKGRDDA